MCVCVCVCTVTFVPVSLCVGGYGRLHLTPNTTARTGFRQPEVPLFYISLFPFNVFCFFVVVFLFLFLFFFCF